MTNFSELAKDRYSVRKFDNRPVETEKIEKIIEAGMVAPTAVNFQPFKIFVIESDEAKAKLYQSTPYPFVKQADVVFVIGADHKTAWVRHFDGKSFADVDASIVATHMMLETHDLGLGTTWVGHFDADKLKTLFPEMEAYDLIAIFPVGYPASDAEPSKTHSVGKSENELVSRL